MTWLEDSLRQMVQQMDAVLGRVLSDAPRPGEVLRPAQLLAAMRHGSLNGGKRLRPLLVAETAAVFGRRDEGVLLAAAALECVHCYSLVHDDLPAMDDDDLRRGQPTVHVKWDEATAILAGDALQTLAFELLADPVIGAAERRVQLVLALAKASGAEGMVLGQASIVVS